MFSIYVELELVYYKRESIVSFFVCLSLALPNSMIKVCKGPNSAETQCCGFLVLKSRCHSFLVLESRKKWLGITMLWVKIVLVFRCRGVLAPKFRFCGVLDLGSTDLDVVAHYMSSWPHFHFLHENKKTSCKIISIILLMNIFNYRNLCNSYVHNDAQIN